MHGSTSPPPPFPVSQPAFKFKRFGVKFQVQSFCCSFFFAVADFFSRTKSFIDIDYNLLYKCVVAKLGSKAGNFLLGKREGEWGVRDTEIEGIEREIDGRN